MQSWSHSKQYEKIGSEASEDGDSLPKHEPRSRASLLTITLTIVNIGSLVLHLILLLRSPFSQGETRNQGLRDSSYFSPIFDRLDIPLHNIQIDATLANENDSIWRKPPSPEVDSAWERVSHLGYHTVSTSDIVRLGKDPSLTVRAPSRWGRGSDVHIVQLDVLHQIHCLNAIRKAMYPEYYPVREVLKEVHPQHCLHILLQNLMCEASVDLITYNWMETQRNPFPDMSINKKCRDFEAVLEWHEDHLVPLQKIDRPEGAKEVLLTPKLRELLADHDDDDEGTEGGM